MSCKRVRQRSFDQIVDEFSTINAARSQNKTPMRKQGMSQVGDSFSKAFNTPKQPPEVEQGMYIQPTPRVQLGHAACWPNQQQSEDAQPETATTFWNKTRDIRQATAEFRINPHESFGTWLPKGARPSEQTRGTSVYIRLSVVASLILVTRAI